MASARRSSVRSNLPARAALSFPSARRVTVFENTTAGAGPRCPRSQASNGTRASSKRSHGLAKDRAVFAGSQSRGFKRTSLHKSRCFFKQEPAVVARRVIARKLDQITPAQEIVEQRLVVGREGRRIAQCGEKLDGGLSRQRELILLGNIPAQNIGDKDAELIRVHAVDLSRGAVELFERTLAGGRNADWSAPARANDQPNGTADQRED